MTEVPNRTGSQVQPLARRVHEGPLLNWPRLLGGFGAMQIHRPTNPMYTYAHTQLPEHLRGSDGWLNDRLTANRAGLDRMVTANPNAYEYVYVTGPSSCGDGIEVQCTASFAGFRANVANGLGLNPTTSVVSARYSAFATNRTMALFS